MANIIQIRRDTSANWASVNPILANGELGLDTTLNKFKIGNGVDTFSVLTFFNSITDAQSSDITANKIKYVELGYAVSDEATDLVIGVSSVTFRMPYAMTLTDVRASVSTAPEGSTLIVDINENGVSILSTKLSIDSTEKTSTTALVPSVISDSSLADDAEITIDIDQIGSTVSGSGLKIFLIGTKT